MFSPIKIGMNGRFFPENKQTARDEIVFAKLAGFDCIQFPGMLDGLTSERIGDPLDVVGLALRRAQITAVMEIVIPLYGNGLTAEGDSPMDVLDANLQAIRALNCTHVHWHLTMAEPMTHVELLDLEQQLVPQMKTAVALAQERHFVFGFEHNSADVPLFHRPEACKALLTAVPGLGFVWDFNHTATSDFEAYAALMPRVSLVHVSDTRWPDVNYHLPLGQGNLDFGKFIAPLVAVRYQGYAILEIGGMPKSGGYGRDTNEALIASRTQFQKSFPPAAS
ncbi:MAG: sugar phosphate isomerase/epimerase [Anaerolineae bacterium]|nr:sugar phosphate isomerase/epimerase [Anaerolineae bacterium]